MDSDIKIMSGRGMVRFQFKAAFFKLLSLFWRRTIVAIFR